MSPASSALCISCANGTGRPPGERKPHPIAGLCGESASQSWGLWFAVMGTFRRSDELDEYETWRFAARDGDTDGRGAVVRRAGKGDGAERVERRRTKRCADSGRCDEVAGEQEIQGREGFGEERGSDFDRHSGPLQREAGCG